MGAGGVRALRAMGTIPGVIEEFRRGGIWSDLHGWGERQSDLSRVTQAA